MGKLFSVFVLFLIVISFVCVRTQDTYTPGEPCQLKELEGVAGECKLLQLCDYADRLINVEFKQPTVCYEDTDTLYVCCPKNLHETGALRETFFNSENGRLISNNIDCRYEGVFPVECCKLVSTNPGTRLHSRVGEKCDRVSNTKTVEACKACYKYQTSRIPNTTCRQEEAIRISGGTTATIEQYPHMVALGTENKKKNLPNEPDIKWVGSGTLITETYVLTAAHVLHSTDDGKIKYALLGTANKTDLKAGFVSSIVQWKRHKLYQPGSHQHDIALVELGLKIPITEFTRPACLPVEGFIPEVLTGTMTVAGWGRTGQHNTTTQILMQGDLQIQDSRVCRKALQSKHSLWNSNYTICAKSDTVDTCYGDSGGPLMGTLVKDSMLCGYYVAGIVSYSTVCGQKNPGAYTKVTNPDYLEWISNIVWPPNSNN